jgi:uncharacterized membrane protein YcaP (DUF421 family)
MGELTGIVLRTVFMYFLIFLIMRLMGKREIGKLSVFDLVISIMIAEIAVIVIESTEKKLYSAFVPILLLGLMQIVIAFLTLKSKGLRDFVDGKPSVLIREGRLNRKEMLKQRYSLDDLLVQLRENDVIDIDEVRLAVLETNGKLSVIKRNENERQATTEKGELDGADDASPKMRFELLPVALIMDGRVQDENLEELGKNRFWLKNELRNYGVDHFKNVFFCSVDHRGKLYVDKKR